MYFIVINPRPFNTSKGFRCACDFMAPCKRMNAKEPENVKNLTVDNMNNDLYVNLNVQCFVGQLSVLDYFSINTTFLNLILIFAHLI